MTKTPPTHLLRARTLGEVLCKGFGGGDASADDINRVTCASCIKEHDLVRYQAGLPWSARGLSSGERVMALRHVDPEAANVRPGTTGVVFEPQNAYGDAGGPMVAWANGGQCNVYEGDCVRTCDIVAHLRKLLGVE